MCKTCGRRGLLEQKRYELVELDNSYHVELAKNIKEVVKVVKILVKRTENRKENSVN
jgi:hypothetical protein